MTMKVTRKEGRPDANQSRVEGGQERPERSSTGGFRDKLSVKGIDPAYVPRWVRDVDENGYRISNCLAQGYEFVRSDSGVKVGQGEVFTSENVGSIIRRPAGSEGDYLYLMQIRREWYEEDQAAKQDRANSLETGVMRNSGKEPGSDDLYGSIKVEHELR